MDQRPALHGSDISRLGEHESIRGAPDRRLGDVAEAERALARRQHAQAAADLRGAVGERADGCVEPSSERGIRRAHRDEARRAEPAHGAVTEQDRQIEIARRLTHLHELADERRVTEQDLDLDPLQALQHVTIGHRGIGGERERRHGSREPAPENAVELDSGDLRPSSAGEHDHRLQRIIHVRGRHGQRVAATRDGPGSLEVAYAGLVETNALQRQHRCRRLGAPRAVTARDDECGRAQ